MPIKPEIGIAKDLIESNSRFRGKSISRTYNDDVAATSYTVPIPNTKA